jgi:D-glycero-D-manno-heptose 1,7-bisphosphate phosphatase
VALGAVDTIPGANGGDDRADGVLIDLDTVMLGMHQGRRGVELNLTADMPASLERLHEVARHIVVLVEPAPRDTMEAHGRETPTRLQTLHNGLGALADDLSVVLCPHGETHSCDCAKPGSGLVEEAIHQTRISPRNSWYIGGDQEGIQAARTAGLRTVRIGPLGGDHLSSVHRPDYEARDLLDAANTIMLDALAPAG